MQGKTTKDADHDTQSWLRMKSKFDSLTQMERVELMRTDITAYLELCTMDHLVGILDGIAKGGPIKEDK